MNPTLVVSIIGATLGAGWPIALLRIRAQNRRLNTDSVKVLTDTATGLVKAVKTELEEAEAEAKALRTEVKELTRQLAEANLLADELKKKLVETQRRADYYESEFQRVTGFNNRRD